MTPLMGTDAVDEDEDDDEDEKQEDELDADDGEADSDPDAKADSTRETCAVAARDAGGVGFEGVSLMGELRLGGRLDEPGSGGDVSVVGT